jgi:hypothetical protein
MPLNWGADVGGLKPRQTDAATNRGRPVDGTCPRSAPWMPPLGPLLGDHYSSLYGWVGSVAGCPLFRSALSETVILLSATFGHPEAIKPPVSRRSEALSRVASDATAVRVGASDGLTG